MVGHYPTEIINKEELLEIQQYLMIIMKSCWKTLPD